MRDALRLARRGYGTTSPNPMVGAVIVRAGKVLGRGWHRQAGLPHAEIEALRDAERKHESVRGATLYVTLEPCSTHGRTPPCTDALITAGVKRVIAGATDPNPRHAGHGFQLLRRAGIQVGCGILESDCTKLNEAFNHWIVHSTPFVTVKAAMTMDGRIATSTGESKWITGECARTEGMRLRQGADAILVGINTILADNPSLTFRRDAAHRFPFSRSNGERPPLREPGHVLRRIILDSRARTPLNSKILTDPHHYLTTIVVSPAAPKSKVTALAIRANVLTAPVKKGRLDLRWLVKKLGSENVSSLLVEGGGEVNASFLFSGLAHRIAFFYAAMILGGRDSLSAVAGPGVTSLTQRLKLTDVLWRTLGPDLLLTASLSESP